VIDQIPETTPPPPTPTATTLTRSASSVQYGYRVTLTAQVTTGVAGSVSFYDGTSLLGSVAVTAGKAVTSPTLRSLGTHTFKAVFAPTSSTYAGSTSGPAYVSVVKANPTLTIGWPTFHSYATNYITVRVTSPNIVPAGYVAVYDGTTRIALGVLNKYGTIKLATPRRARGWHVIKVTYLGKSPLNARSAAKKVYFN
jgi:hypothetical protein